MGNLHSIILGELSCTACSGKLGSTKGDERALDRRAFEGCILDLRELRSRGRALGGANGENRFGAEVEAVVETVGSLDVLRVYVFFLGLEDS
jgi:hypothetical protein